MPYLEAVGGKLSVQKSKSAVHRLMTNAVVAFFNLAHRINATMVMRFPEMPKMMNIMQEIVANNVVARGYDTGWNPGVEFVERRTPEASTDWLETRYLKSSI